MALLPLLTFPSYNVGLALNYPTVGASDSHIVCKIIFLDFTSLQLFTPVWLSSITPKVLFLHLTPLLFQLPFFFLISVEFFCLSFRLSSLPLPRSWSNPLVPQFLVKDSLRYCTSSISTSKNTCSSSLDWDLARAIPDRKELWKSHSLAAGASRKSQTSTRHFTDLTMHFHETTETSCGTVFGLANNLCLMNTRLPED